MGNCCNQSGPNISSLKQSSTIQVKMITWNKDSHDLFDYENVDRTIQTYSVSTSVKFYRDPSSGKIEIGSMQGRALLSLLNQNNQFVVQRQSKEDLPVWIIVKQLQRVQVNDVIRVGKVLMKLKEVQFSDRCDNRETITSQSVDEERCRICLIGSESADDPKIAPCCCSGTMALIHLKCLQHWIVTKYNLEGNHIIVFMWDQMKCELCKTNFKRKIMLNGSQVDLIELSKRQFNNYAIVEIKKNISRVERCTYILNLEKLEQFKVGRANDNHIRLCDISVSRFHCKLVLTQKEFYVADNNSKFGTLLKAKQAQPITYSFQVGRTIFEFS